jgi:hypothetical protein
VVGGKRRWPKESEAQSSGGVLSHHDKGEGIYRKQSCCDSQQQPRASAPIVLQFAREEPVAPRDCIDYLQSNEDELL